MKLSSSFWLLTCSMSFSSVDVAVALVCGTPITLVTIASGWLTLEKRAPTRAQMPDSFSSSPGQPGQSLIVARKFAIAMFLDP